MHVADRLGELEAAAGSSPRRRPTARGRRSPCRGCDRRWRSPSRRRPLERLQRALVVGQRLGVIPWMLARMPRFCSVRPRIAGVGSAELERLEVAARASSMAPLSKANPASTLSASPASSRSPISCARSRLGRPAPAPSLPRSDGGAPRPGGEAPRLRSGAPRQRLRSCLLPGNNGSPRRPRRRVRVPWHPPITRPRGGPEIPGPPARPEARLGAHPATTRRRTGRSGERSR